MTTLICTSHVTVGPVHYRAGSTHVMPEGMARMLLTKYPGSFTTAAADRGGPSRRDKSFHDEGIRHG